MNYVTINNQKIAWSFIMKVRKRFGGNWDSTIDAFWKARNASGSNAIIKYIEDGFKPDEKNNRHTMFPSKEREAGHMESIRIWWNTEVYKPKRQLQSTGDILRQILAGNLQ